MEWAKKPRVVDVPPTPRSSGLLAQVVTVADPASSCTTYPDGRKQTGKASAMDGHFISFGIFVDTKQLKRHRGTVQHRAELTTTTLPLLSTE